MCTTAAAAAANPGYFFDRQKCNCVIGRVGGRDCSTYFAPAPPLAILCKKGGRGGRFHLRDVLIAGGGGGNGGLYYTQLKMVSPLFVTAAFAVWGSKAIAVMHFYPCRILGGSLVWDEQQKKPKMSSHFSLQP